MSGDALRRPIASREALVARPDAYAHPRELLALGFPEVLQREVAETDFSHRAVGKAGQPTRQLVLVWRRYECPWCFVVQGLFYLFAEHFGVTAAIPTVVQIRNVVSGLEDGSESYGRKWVTSGAGGGVSWE